MNLPDFGSRGGVDFSSSFRAAVRLLVTGIRSFAFLGGIFEAVSNYKYPHKKFIQTVRPSVLDV